MRQSYLQLGFQLLAISSGKNVLIVVIELLNIMKFAFHDMGKFFQLIKALHVVIYLIKESTYF